MTQLQKRRKLAEYEGWKVRPAFREGHFQLFRPPDVYPSCSRDTGYIRETEDECFDNCSVPFYFGDLNACAALEVRACKEQPPGFLAAYAEALTERCSKRQNPHWRAICALAEDKAEALGVTLKLWEA